MISVAIFAERYRAFYNFYSCLFVIHFAFLTVVVFLAFALRVTHALRLASLRFLARADFVVPLLGVAFLGAVFDVDFFVFFELLILFSLS